MAAAAATLCCEAGSGQRPGAAAPLLADSQRHAPTHRIRGEHFIVLDASMTITLNFKTSMHGSEPRDRSCGTMRHYIVSKLACAAAGWSHSSSSSESDSVITCSAAPTLSAPAAACITTAMARMLDIISHFAEELSLTMCRRYERMEEAWL